MTPSSLTLRLLLVRVTATPGDLSVVKHSRYRHEFLKSLSEEERRLCSRKIPRASLLTLAASPWRNLLASGINQSLITMTGFDGVSFASLLQKFAPLFDENTPFHTSHILLKQDPSKGGCPRKVRPEDCLGLVLIWTRTAHERFPNGLTVDFWYDMLQSLHVFTLWLPRDRRDVEE